jgi:hypothetical protein
VEKSVKEKYPLFQTSTWSYMKLNHDQITFWEENGFLVLPLFFSSTEIDNLEKGVQQVWKECPSNVLVDDLVASRRCFMSDLSEQDKTHHFKVMDLFLNYTEIRNFPLNNKLTPALEPLIDGPPVLIATLNFEKGSQQPIHADSIYLTPETEGHLIATWIAMEDVHPDAGGLVYIPGSHKIKPYVFSDGGHRSIESEMEDWMKFKMGEVERRGLKPQTFPAKKGDVFIWHAELLHGGSEINDYKKTRKSMVSHYASLRDSKILHRKLIQENGGYWHHRAPVGSTKQIKDMLPFPHLWKKAANMVVPPSIKGPLKGLIRKVFGIQ